MAHFVEKYADAYNHLLRYIVLEKGKVSNTILKYSRMQTLCTYHLDKCQFIIVDDGFSIYVKENFVQDDADEVA